MQEVSRLLSIKGLTSMPYHPICNGLVKRWNKTLKSMLEALSRPAEAVAQTDQACLCIEKFKVMVTAQLSNFSPFTAIHTVRSHNSTLVQARKLILSVYVYLIIIYKFYKYRHA